MKRKYGSWNPFKTYLQIQITKNEKKSSDYFERYSDRKNEMYLFQKNNPYKLSFYRIFLYIKLIFFWMMIYPIIIMAITTYCVSKVIDYDVILPIVISLTGIGLILVPAIIFINRYDSRNAIKEYVDIKEKEKIEKIYPKTKILAQGGFISINNETHEGKLSKAINNGKLSIDDSSN